MIVEEIKKHLQFESSFRRCITLLKEERGSIPCIASFVSRFKRYFAPQADNALKNKGQDVQAKYTEKTCANIFDNIKDIFFNEFVFDISACVTDRNNVTGKTNILQALKKDKNGNVTCVPYITLYVEGKSVADLNRTLLHSMGHELTHLYNMFQYLKKGYSLSDMTDYYKQNYSGVTDKMFFGDNYEQIIGRLFYYFNRMERNAYIAQLKQELTSIRDKMVDAQSIYDAIRETESFKVYTYIENAIAEIVKVDDNEIGKRLVEITSELSGKKINTIGQMKKYFIGRWMKWKKKYMSVASKIAYDIYDEGTVYNY